MKKILQVCAKLCVPGNNLNKYLMWYLGISGINCLLIGIYYNSVGTEDVFVRYAPIAGFGMSAAVIIKNYSLAARLMKSLGGGNILECLLPPDEADHRIIELDEAMARWVSKYGQKRAEILYIWQSLISAALFWFDRVVVKVLARK